MRTLIIGDLDIPGHRAPTSLNLLDPSTFELLDEYDIIVNARDSRTQAPDEAIRRCWRRNCTFLQVSVDGETAERLLLFGRNKPRGRATVVLGAGLAPGLTNLLAAKAVGGRPVSRIEIGYRLDGLSGIAAGAAVIAARALGATGVRYCGGERIVDSGATRLEFPFDGLSCAAYRIAAPESAMLHWSTGAQFTSTYLAESPLSSVAARTAIAVRRIIPKAFQRPMRGLALPFASTMGSATLTALIDRDGSDPRSMSLCIPDVQSAHLRTITSMIAQLANARPGMYLPDEIFSLESIISQEPQWIAA